MSKPPTPVEASQAEVLAQAEEVASSSWLEPIPFDAWEPPAFPIEVLPRWAAEFSGALATATQTPVDLVAMLVLSALSVSVLGKVELEARPGWREPLNLYTVTALDSGNRKSAVFREVTRPIEAELAERFERDRPQVMKARLRREALERQLEAAKRTGTGKKPVEPDVEVLVRLQTDIDELAKVQESPHLLADDVTPEAVAGLLHRSGGQLGILSAEGDLFQVLAGRYSSSGKPNFSIFLKAYSGDMVRVDRAGKDRSSIHLPRPLLAIGIATQPSVVRGLCGIPEFAEQGLLARFLYAIPTDMLGRRNPNPPAMSDRVRNMYAGRLRRILSWSRPEQAELLKLDTEAQGVLASFCEWIEPELLDHGQLGDMRAWGAKLTGQVLRIAGLLHLADLASDRSEPWREPMEASTLSRAIHLARQHLIPHARTAFTLMGRSQANEDAQFLLRWIGGKKLREFSQRDAFEHARARFPKSELLEPVLDLLVSRNYIRPLVSARRVGRPSKVFEVNPNFADNAYFAVQMKDHALSLSLGSQNTVMKPFVGWSPPLLPEPASTSLPPAQNTQNTQNAFLEWSDSEQRSLADLL